MAEASSTTIPVAFLFATPLVYQESEEGLYEAFLRALKVADSKGTVETRVCFGRVLLSQLSYKVAAVKTKRAKGQKPDTAEIYQISRVERSDRDLYAVLVGDFVESCLERWHTLDHLSFWDKVGCGSLDAVFLSALAPEIAAQMDHEMRSHLHYIGAVSPDLGNPLHRYLFIEAMHKDAFVRGGRLHVKGGSPGQPASVLFGAAGVPCSGLGIVPYAQFSTAAPPLIVPKAISARGLVSEMRMERRMALDVHQKVMLDLSSSRSLCDLDVDFEWDLSQLPDAPEQVNVQASKLADYLLNSEHAGNQGKAKFFEEYLGITKADWNYLQSQLLDALNHTGFRGGLNS